MSARAHISLETKLASALLALGIVPYEHAKKMSAAQLISLVEWHHNILHSTEPNNEFWNIEPMPIMEHRKRFPVDAAVAAKVKRLRGETRQGPRKKIAPRPFSKQHRPLRSRNTFERRVP